MNKQIINKNNLTINDIDEFCDKARAIIIDDNNRVLIANYGGVILLPGGSIDLDTEDISKGLIRELNEEIGVAYTEEELDYVICLEFYQNNYPKRDGTFQNRLVRTYYYTSKFKGILKSSQLLTEKEKKDKFQLSLVPINELKELIIQNKDTNPRNIYFQEELLAVLEIFDISTIISKNKKKVLEIPYSKI